MALSPQQHLEAIKVEASGPAAILDKIVEGAQQNNIKDSQVMFAVEIPKNTPGAAIELVVNKWEGIGWIVKHTGAWRGGEAAVLHFSMPAHVHIP